MTSLDQPMTTWQEWLDTADEFISYNTWKELGNAQGSANAPLNAEFPLQFIGVGIAYVHSALLATLQESASEVEPALRLIQHQMHDIHPEKPKVKPGLRKAYTEFVNIVAPLMSDAGDLLYSAFMDYAQGDYTLHADTNLLIRDSLRLLDAGAKDEARRIFGHAVIVTLRGEGKEPWSEWHAECFDEAQSWIMVLTLIQQLSVLPLGDIAEERLRAGERAEALQPKMPQSISEQSFEQVLSTLEAPLAEDNAKMNEAELMNEWTGLVSHAEPLTDAEIEQMGERYDADVDYAIYILSAIGAQEKLSKEDFETILIFTHGLGVLRYHEDTSAAYALIALLPVVSNNIDNLGELEWSLQQIGPIALHAMVETVRYTSDGIKYMLLLEMLGRIGSGNDEVFEFLAQRFEETTWDNEDDDKIAYMDALATLEDMRALPLLVQALRDPNISPDNLASVLDALETMDAPMTVDDDSGDVTIAGYGTFKGLAPEEWMPAKLEDDDEDKFEALGEDEEGAIDLDALFPDEDGEQDNDADLLVQDGAIDEKPSINFGPVHVEHIGRNDPCPCGSGKKYKHCHGKNL